METAMAVGGWFAQTIIESSIGTLTSSAIEQYTLHPGLNDALPSLKTSLSKANAVLAISLEMKAEQHLTVLLKQLKEAAYDASDLLGELEFEELKKRVEDEEDHISTVPLSKKQKTHQLSGLLPCAFKFASDFLNDATSKVKEVQKRLDEITTAIQQVISISSVVVSNQKAESYRVREESSSFLLDPKVYGRDVDLKKLTEFVLKPDEASQPSNKVAVPVISLVGMGGVGKTTLAQLTYSELKDKFEETIWICASDPFDVNRLTREIVETVDKENSKLMRLDRLQGIVMEKLASKRFLLVIDDVWSEDWKKWESFYAPLRLGASGSKILVTTRSHKVASTINSKYTMPLEGLQEDEYYSFFNRCAFGYEDPKKYGNMEVIGRKIAVRLKGSPLAAKTLGSLLKSRLNEDYWRTILHSEIWNLQQSENDIMPALKLSFDNLSHHLKPCFAYCSLFPKDYVFQKDTLIQMWIAQDFIRPEANLQVDDVGSRYFDDLLSRCFFQNLPIHRYILHDLLHDLAQSISEDEFVRLEYGRPRDIPSTVRHLSICVPYPELNITDIRRYKKLRTLLFVNIYKGFLDIQFSHGQVEDLLSDLIYVRVLKLRGLNTLPVGIGNLKQLRYLDISGTKVYKLPESLGLLYNLHSIEVSPFEPIVYPKVMENLVNLRNVPSVKFVDQIADIRRLTSLQGLRTFNIQKKLGHKIEELQKLNELKGKFCIEHLECINSKEEARKAKLKDKKHLRVLLLKWASDSTKNLKMNVSDSEVLDGLQPHPNLEELEIENYGGLRYPSWLECQLLSNLMTIRLIHCKNMEQLPPLGQLPFLKVLQLEGLNAVKKIGKELYGTTTELKTFLLLEELVLRDMLGWEEWSLELEAFPCLSQIIIENCPKLRVLPCPPPTVSSLTICNTELNEFPSLARLSRQCQIIIQNCPKLKFLPSLPPKVVRLEIKNMELNELPPLGHFSHQCKIVIENCPKLKVLPSLPSTVSFLQIKNMKLKEFPPLGHFSRECRILIENCPKMKVLPCLPLTVVGLQIENMELNEFPPLGHLSCLRTLRYGHMVAVRRIEDLFGTAKPKGFLSLEELEFVNMPELEEWSGAYGSQFLPCLSTLVIEECPKLRNLPSLPPSLETLRLIAVGLEALPELWISQDNNSSSCQSASLSKLSIERCPNLQGLEEWLLPNQLPALTEMSIIDCAELTSLAIERFKDLTCLYRLTLKDCPKLTSAAAQAGENNNHLFFPSSLRTLELGYCGDLERSLLLCLRGATSLFRLTLSNFSHITSLPGEFCHHMTTLGDWTLEGLTELKTLGSLKCFTSLGYLAFKGCPKLKAMPEDGLPVSLDHLVLDDCHSQLKVRCQRDTGDDWHKIAHIRHMIVDRNGCAAIYR